MQTKDLHNNIDVRRVVSPVSVADNTAQVGQIIDRAGFDSLEFIVVTGSLADADATFAVLLEHSDVSDLSSGKSTVTDAETISTQTLASFINSDDDKIKRIGYIGGKRYVRMTITPSNNTAAALIAACAVLGNPTYAPTASA